MTKIIYYGEGWQVLHLDGCTIRGRRNERTHHITVARWRNSRTTSGPPLPLAKWWRDHHEHGCAASSLESPLSSVSGVQCSSDFSSPVHHWWLIFFRKQRPWLVNTTDHCDHKPFQCSFSLGSLSASGQHSLHTCWPAKNIADNTSLRHVDRVCTQLSNSKHCLIHKHLYSSPIKHARSSCCPLSLPILIYRTHTHTRVSATNITGLNHHKNIYLMILRKIF